MGNKFLVFGIAFLSCFSIANACEASNRASDVCKDQSAVQQSCRWISGTLEIYNGTPAVRLTEKSTHKRFAVGPSEEELIPAELKNKLDPNSTIEGSFKICPMKRVQPHGFQEICIDKTRMLK